MEPSKHERNTNMHQLKSVKYNALYLCWGALFVITVVLGFLFPVADGALKIALRLISVVFFIPPWIVLIKAKQEQNKKHRALVRHLSLASLILTLILLVLNLRSVGYSDAVGLALHAALTVVSAPMICSHLYALPIFLWATLLMGSIGKLKSK